MGIGVASRVRFARALQSRPFALLWGGQTISALGDGAYMPALAWQVLVLTHSSAAMAAILSATIISRLIFLLLGGLIADRLPRRLVLFCSDAGRAFVVGGITILGWTNHLALWHLIVLGAIFGAVGAFFLPVYRAMPPQLVTKEALPSANALTELSGQLGQLLGPLLGAALVAVAGPATAFAFDSVSFVVSAASLYAIRIPASLFVATAAQRKGIEGQSTAGSRASIWDGLRKIAGDLREAWLYILGSTWLLTTIVIPAFGNAAFGGAMLVTLPKLINDVYGGQVWLIGAIVTCIALGRISAAFVVGQFHLKHRGIIAFVADIVASFALLTFGLPLPGMLRPTLALGAGTLYGFGGGTFQTIWVTLLHEIVPNEKLGRVASIDLLGSFCLQPVGFVVAGFAADSIGPSWVFLGAGTINLALYSLPLLLHGIRKVQ